MEKYDLLRAQLLYEGTIELSNLFEPEPANRDTVLLTHSMAWYKKLIDLTLSKSEIRQTGFPLSANLIKRELTIMGGTLDCARFALEYGAALNIAGGTHHAHRSMGHGFCLLNDNAIAANWLLQQQLVKKILIIDLDVHQGDGTATIFANNPNVFTFSMHGERNFPLRKWKSDLDISLPDGSGDSVYLPLLKEKLEELFHTVRPEFVFYQSGVDVLSTDKLGRLSLTIEGCRERDRLVLSHAKEWQVPITCSMGGGYSEKISVVVEAHANTFRLAQDLFF